MNRVLAVLRQRCPRCYEGKVWAGPLTMWESCTVCGFVFEREPGYFTGAMYGSYILGIGITLPVWLTMLLMGAPWVWIMAVTGVQMLILFPLLFRYSRVLWLHFDVFFNGPGEPSGESETAPR